MLRPSTSASCVVDSVSIRTIALDGIAVASRGKEVRVSAESSLVGDRLTLHRFEARSGTTTLDAEGEIDLAPNVVARLKAQANKLDVDELLALADAFTPPQPSSQAAAPSAPMKIAARVSAETATAPRALQIIFMCVSRVPRRHSSAQDGARLARPIDS